MEENQKIQISFAGKAFSLKVGSLQEEEIARAAAKMIEEKIESLKKQFILSEKSDDRDYLAVAALIITSELISRQKFYESNELIESLKGLDKRLTEYIQSSSR